MKDVVISIKDYKHIRTYIKKYNYVSTLVGLNIDNKVIYNEKEVDFDKYDIKDNIFWLILIISAINIKDKRDKYRYIYDKMCDILDRNVCFLCDFNCDKCVANRENKSKYEINGCCYFRNLDLCPFFKNRKCMTKSISCKLFMCCYMEKKYKFKSLPKTYPLLNLFFNRNQQDILQHSYRKNFDEIIDMLLIL